MYGRRSVRLQALAATVRCSASTHRPIISHAELEAADESDALQPSNRSYPALSGIKGVGTEQEVSMGTSGREEYDRGASGPGLQDETFSFWGCFGHGDGWNDGEDGFFPSAEEVPRASLSSTPQKASFASSAVTLTGTRSPAEIL
ncbi:hypothetical protein B0H10DRAFT_2200329 [Mycena sp. CBHHK59/15]|nr:hypothetical protein B0H10DRAFT_2200329 [Mycena sp. CBHHK59/15]